LSDTVDHGITVTEVAATDQPIDVSPETTAAFVGRALRGPLNTPVLVRSFAEFRRLFGDVTSGSSLGPATKQFFEHGGVRLYVVRVANNARGAMICLPARGSALVLRAVQPGSAEIIRAAVDYDGIDDGEHFNLTVQRLNPSSHLVQDQEYLEKVSYLKESKRFVGDALAMSTLARVEHPYPAHRPEATVESAWRPGAAYVDAAQSGNDGADLSDYDLVGSRTDGTGLFALDPGLSFDILYLPPPGAGIVTGPAAILAAEMFCRARRAMLIVDPHPAWASAGDAVQGIRELGYASPNMIGYYPLMRDRESNDKLQSIGGAIAGLLCKQDRTVGPWGDVGQPGLGLQRRFVPGATVDDEDAAMLKRAGLNVIAVGSAGRSRVTGAVTMARGSDVQRTFGKLPVRRFCLRIISAIRDATKWSIFEQWDKNLARRVRAQVLTYFYSLHDLGAFADHDFAVECDAGVSRRSDRDEHGVTLMLRFRPASSDEPVSLTLHLTASGCRVGSTAFGPQEFT
jgi:phage tail sheath protein FI